MGGSSAGKLKLIFVASKSVSHRFPSELEKKYRLNLPKYPGYEQIVELPSAADESIQKL